MGLSTGRGRATRPQHELLRPGTSQGVAPAVPPTGPDLEALGQGRPWGGCGRAGVRPPQSVGSGLSHPLFLVEGGQELAQGLPRQHRGLRRSPLSPAPTLSLSGLALPLWVHSFLVGALSPPSVAVTVAHSHTCPAQGPSSLHSPSLSLSPLPQSPCPTRLLRSSCDPLFYPSFRSGFCI